jgi:hypothetical protein
MDKYFRVILLQTSIPINIIRNIYRPFQSDTDWEWPFKKSTLKKINENFNILDQKGILCKIITY